MEEKFALVTGSSRSIGKATVLQLAKDGFNIFIHSKSSMDKANEVKKEIEELGRKAWVLQGDITIDLETQRLAQEVSTITDRLDLLVNSAGFDYGYMIEDYTMEQMRYIVDIVLISKMSMTKAFLPLLKKSPYASIINIASRMGKEKTIETIGAYGPAEAGVIKFTQCCALEFKEYKIRVNCVAPGLTDTDLTRGIMPDQKDWDAIANANPSGRVGQPQDIANVVSFLVSEKASYINGETIGVNGGSNLG